MRTLIRAGALTAGVSAMLFLGPAAHALSLATPHGDNGTVKIHDATTGEELHQNEPHVCTFYLDAFDFDSVQEVDWHIEAWAPTEGGTVKSGEITLDDQGHGRTEDLSLPDGHYKLFWKFEGENGAAKHKVFWTDCEDSASPTPSEGTGGGGTSPSPSPSSTVSSSASPTDTEGVTPSPSSSEEGSGPAVDPSASASPSGQGGAGDLAETGSSAPAGLLSAAALALVGAGAYLVLRRRKAAGN
ncbi:LPXTG cell wall anchor domain-containing protein [Streptomyces sp. ME02-8801-2C]|uniref:LPXTG cell wall anchor domain-containing protein n=1 Tax=Streptomyces sp. ME02-8801-2C TaxID=3028680 RepID=UPI0029BF53AC|nr:LPXTG cell wall anchor domain-containing protein [Streptomyces sp. ME02-8801-2C]MDX3457503.1 LPXTG cell wall anchor domain-containing protein [Streptomyces sp. ME02-8801-2C]